MIVRIGVEDITVEAFVVVSDLEKHRTSKLERGIGDEEMLELLKEGAL